MAIPDFQTIMLPLLRHLGDGKDHASRETLTTLGEHFRLTDEDLSELLPSGVQPLFYNRIAWAKSHLKAAGCIDSPKRGVYRITDRGRALLTQGLSEVNMQTLREFPEYRAFRTPKKGDDDPVAGIEPSTDETRMTPDEHLEYGYRTIRQEVATELVDRIKGCSAAFFEGLVVDLLLAMGYGGSRQDAGRTVGRSGDGGIDGVIKEDRLGLDAIYIQAKRWEGVVGRPEIQKFAGALQGRRAKKGVFITTSTYSKDAREYANQIDSKIVLVDGATLAELMIDFGLGVTRTAKYEISRVDSDYFDEE